MERIIKQQAISLRTKDGAALSLVRGVGNTTADVYDPVLIVSITTKG